MSSKRLPGFTLVELMIAVLIVSIITLIGSNVYTGYVRKGRRIDAINSLLSISLAEERYRTTNAQYGTLAQVWSGVSTSIEGYYTLAISSVSASSYTITATANGTQSNDSESGTSCSSLALTVSSGTMTKTPAVCWPT